MNFIYIVKLHIERTFSWYVKNCVTTLRQYDTVCGMSVVYDKVWVICICTRGLCCVTTLKQYDTVCGMSVVYDKVWILHILYGMLCHVTACKHYYTVCGMSLFMIKCEQYNHVILCWWPYQ
jgi:hypothetical protein